MTPVEGTLYYVNFLGINSHFSYIDSDGDSVFVSVLSLLNVFSHWNLVSKGRISVISHTQHICSVHLGLL